MSIKFKSQFLNDIKITSELILKDWKRRVEYESTKGRKYIILYRYKNRYNKNDYTDNEEYKNLQKNSQKIYFYLNGSKEMGLNIFKKYGVVPLINVLENEIEQYGLSLYYIQNKYFDEIYVCWSDIPKIVKEKININKPIIPNIYSLEEQQLNNYKYILFNNDSNYSNNSNDSNNKTFIFLDKLIKNVENYDTKFNKTKNVNLLNYQKDLFFKVIKDYEEKIENAKQNNKYFVNIFRYDGETEYGKRCSFLLKGNKNEKNNLFNKQNIIPLINLLEKYFTQRNLTVSLKYFGNSYNNEPCLGNVIELRW